MCQIFSLFVNTLTANDKYSLLNRVNLRQPIQMELCQKQIAFFSIFLFFKNGNKFLQILKKKKKKKNGPYS